MANENISEQNVPEHQIDVPATVKYPSVKYNPAYEIKTDDKVEVIIKLNDNEVKSWTYSPSIDIPASECRLFVCKLAIAKGVKTVDPE